MSKGTHAAPGIQGTAAAFVVRVDGCYNNVVGFPLQAFAAHVSSLMKQQLL
jgi:predicted house-cleaning NTP pyrophosphatase (Maf/HAM1 superfamily)